MKKTILFIALCALSSLTFAQQLNFKPIQFKSCMPSHWNPMEFNSLTSGLNQHIAGVIDISTKDSVILITPEGQTPLRYKITKIDPEDDDKKAGKKTISIACIDSDRKECTTKIERIKDGSSPYMKVSVIYNGSLMAYFCDYAKKLYL